MTALSEEAPSCQASNAGGPGAATAKLDELSARANVEPDTIEALNRRVVCRTETVRNRNTPPGERLGTWPVIVFSLLIGDILRRSGALSSVNSRKHEIYV